MRLYRNQNIFQSKQKKKTNHKGYIIGTYLQFSNEKIRLVKQNIIDNIDNN